MTNYQNLPYKVIGLDTSKWEGQMNPQKTFAAGAHFILPKATHGTVLDPQFKNTWNNYRGILKRGAFHWLTINESIKAQAKAFAAALKDDPGEIEPYVDFEEPRKFWVRRNPVTGQRGWNVLDISHLNGFMKYFRDEFPVWPWKDETGIYSGYSYWREHGSLSPEWTKHPLWISDPDPVSNPDVPAPWGYWLWKFWQTDYAADGIKFGTDPLQAKGVDMNVYRGTLEEFEAEYGTLPESGNVSELPQSTDDIPTQPPAVYVVAVDPTKQKVIIPSWGFKSAAKVAEETGANIVVNLGNHDQTTGRPIGLFMSAGKGGWYYSGKFYPRRKSDDYSPFINVDSRGVVSIRTFDRSPEYSACALNRLIVDGGKTWNAPSKSWLSKVARTLFGIDKDGKLIIVVTDNAIDLYEAAEIMKGLGCVRAADADSDWSTYLLQDGVVMNKPVSGKEELVSTHLCVI